MNEHTSFPEFSRPGDIEPWPILADAIEFLSAAIDLEAIVATVLDFARRLSGADGVCFVLRDRERCHYIDENAIGPLWKGRRFPMSACISGWSMTNRRTAIIPDIYRDRRIPHDAYRPTFVKSLVMFPVGGEEPVAAIGVYWATQGVPQAATVLALETLARATATALAGTARRRSLLTRIDELAALYQLTDRLYRAQSLPDIFEAAMDAIFSVLGCRRSAILTFDDLGSMHFVAWRGLSERYRQAVQNHSPWRAEAQDMRPKFVAEIDSTDELEGLKAAMKVEGIRAFALIPLVAQGTVIGRFVAYYDTPHAFTHGETSLAITIARQLGFSLERIGAEKARNNAVQELRRNEERLRLATQTGKIGICEWDIIANRVSWTDSLYAIHGVDKGSFVATVEGFAALVHPEDREYVSGAIRCALEEDAPYELEFRTIKPDGQVVWIFTSAIVLREGVKPVRMVGASFDTTERKEAETHRKLLIDELNHRVKDTLAIVQGIAQQTFRDGNLTAQARRTFEGRLAALASAHSLLARGDWKTASLNELAEEAISACGTAMHRVATDGPRILLQPNQAGTIAIALHELCTNALKYGALSNHSGTVTFVWRIHTAPEPWLTLVWSERGGPAVTPPDHRGFGLRMIEQALAQDLGGEVKIEYRPEGLVCTIDAPLPEG